MYFSSYTHSQLCSPGLCPGLIGHSFLFYSQIQSDIPKWLDKEQRRDSNSAHWSQRPECYLTPWNHHFCNFISRKVCLWFGSFHSLIRIMPVHYCLDHCHVQPQSHRSLKLSTKLSKVEQVGSGKNFCGLYSDHQWVVEKCS